MQLYKLAAGLKELSDALDACETDEQINVVLAKANLDKALPEKFAEKIESAIHVWKNKQADVAALESEKSKWAARLSTAQFAERNLKNYIKFCMELAGEEKLNAGLFKVALQRNGLPTTEFLGTELEKLPKQFLRVTTAIDLTAVKEHYDELVAKALPAVMKDRKLDETIPADIEAAKEIAREAASKKIEKAFKIKVAYGRHVRVR